MNQKKKLIKIAAVSVGSVLGVIVAAALIIPLVVNVDKYRPLIVQTVNEKINGKFELGELSLSLWGRLQVKVHGLSLQDTKSRNVVSVADASLRMSWMTLFGGAPEMVLFMKNPQVNILKDNSGQMNVAAIMKSALPAPIAAAPVVAPSSAPLPVASKIPAPTPSPTVQAFATPTAFATPVSIATTTAVPSAIPSATPSPTPAAVVVDTTASKTIALPSIVTKAKIDFELQNAIIDYKDEPSGISAGIKDLNLRLKDLSMNRASDLEIWADIDTVIGAPKDANKLTVKGEAKVNGKLRPYFVDGRMDEIIFKGKVDLDRLEVMMPGIFEKKSGMAASIEGQLAANDHHAQIDDGKVKFFNAEVMVRGDFTLTNQRRGAHVSLNLKSNDIDLKSWPQLIPPLKQLQLSTGHAFFEAGALGHTDALEYHANLVLNGIKAKPIKFKQVLDIDGALVIVKDQIESFALSLKAPNSDLNFKGKLVSFSKPRAEMSVLSNGIDLDSLVELPPMAAKAASETVASAPSSASKTTAVNQQQPEAKQDSGKSEGVVATKPVVTDYDKSLDALRESQVALNTSANLPVNIRSLKVYNVTARDILTKIFMQDLVVATENLQLGIWNGTARANAAIQLKPAHPVYRFGFQVSGIDIKDAVTSQFALFKDTVYGKASFKADGDGVSFDPEPAKKKLRLSGNMKIEKAVFATIDVAKMAVEAVNNAIEHASAQIPQLRGKKLAAVGGRQSRYDLISSDFAMADQKFSLSNFMAKAEPNQGIDINGQMTIGITDEYPVTASWRLADTYNLTHAADFEDKILAEGGKWVVLPVSLGCKLKSPCVSYAEVPAYFTKVVIDNLARKTKGKAIEKLKDLTQRPEVKKGIDDLKKKLFGR
jgi:hypothetical protein